MTIYRVYVEEAGPRDWVEYVEAESEQHAKAQVEDDPNDWLYLAALPLPAEMMSECVCSETAVQFKRVDNTDPNPTPDDMPWSWQCQACQRAFICPPDEINWEHQRMFDAGYEICGCDHYDTSCRCHGAGWYRPGDDDDEGDGYVARFDEFGYCEANGEWCPDPYYEEDIELEMEDPHDCPCGCGNDPKHCVYTGTNFSCYELCACGEVKYQTKPCEHCGSTAHQYPQKEEVSHD